MNAPLTDRRNHSQVSSSLDVFLLGTVDLESSKELQERLRSDIALRSDSHGAILVCERGAFALDGLVVLRPPTAVPEGTMS